MRDRLLIRHFLWRFVEHDLVSPNADRRDVFAVAGGTVMAINLFVAVLIGWSYQLNRFMPPGIASIRSIDDRFLFISVTLLVSALAAVAQWDALVLDVRDTAVLGPLPIPKSVIVRTKFAATALFGLAVIVGTSLPSIVLRLAAIPSELPVGMPGALWLTLAHAVCIFAAGAFGFLGVLALRETTFALVGPRRFRGVSALMQAALVVVLMTMLLLLPGESMDVVRHWLSAKSQAVRLIPVFWFVGLHESIAGSVLDSLPRVQPERYLVLPERLATELYRGLWPLYGELARTALVALTGVAAIATGACLWNSRRLPTMVTQTDRGGGALRRRLRWIAVHGLVKTPLEQAGFFLALQTLSRRASHRIPMAGAFAIGLSLVVIAASGTRTDAIAAAVPPALLAAQPLLIASVVTGFRHATRLPSELRASTSFTLAWPGETAPYVAGVKRAGWIAVVLPSLALMGLWHIAVLGPQLALLHGVVGLAFAVLLMDVLFLNSTRVPFASAHVPDVDAKSHNLIYLIGLLIASLFVSGVERWALDTPERTVAFLAMLAGLVAALRLVARGAQPPVITIDLDEPQSLPTQRLNLAG